MLAVAPSAAGVVLPDDPAAGRADGVRDAAAADPDPADPLRRCSGRRFPRQMIDQAPESGRLELVLVLSSIAIAGPLGSDLDGGHPYGIRWVLSQILPYRSANGALR